MAPAHNKIHYNPGDLIRKWEFVSYDCPQRTSGAGQFVLLKCPYCQKEVPICLKRARNGQTESCGCNRKSLLQSKLTKHGMSGHTLSNKFNKMKSRCYNPKDKRYNDYGGRGITICKEWLSDGSKFYTWALENGYKDGLQIDRIDNDKGYSPDNCRFVSQLLNSRNRRDTIFVELDGVKMAATEASERLGFNPRYLAGIKFGTMLFSDELKQRIKFL